MWRFLGRKSDRLLSFCFQKGFTRNATEKLFFTTLSQSNAGKESKIHLFLLAIPISTFGLGCWQVKRLAWKKGLIKELEERTTADPLPMPENIEDLNAADLEYRRLHLKGSFDHSRELHLMPRSLNVEGGSTGGLGKKPKSGAHILTPFILANSGQRILVNRGWVPVDKIKPENRLEGQVEGEVDIVVFVRQDEKRAQFAPKNNIQMNRWHYRDLEAMAEAANCLPIQVDVDAGSSVRGGPIGGQTRVNLRNEHLQYIITWYALSAATAYMYYRLRKKPHTSFG